MVPAGGLANVTDPFSPPSGCYPAKHNNASEWRTDLVKAAKVNTPVLVGLGHDDVHALGLHGRRPRAEAGRRQFPERRREGPDDAPVVEMEPGSVLDGRCRMTKDKAADAPHSGVVVPLLKA